MAASRPAPNVPRMNCDTVQDQVAAVAETLQERTDELALLLARAITREVRLYQSAAPVPFELVVEGCAANVRPIFTAIATETEFDPTAATALGVARARDEVPLSSVMEAYRVGFRRVWDAMVAESATRAQMTGHAMHTLTAKLHTAQDVFTAAMATGYRHEQTRLLIGDESRRSVLIDSLLHGRVFEQWNLWEVADYLRLPTAGPFVVIAAEIPVVGAEALPGIEPKLRSLDVFSAWRLLPDVHIGIVHYKNDIHLANVLALVSRIATNRVGVSARFDDLRDTAQALRFARMMLRGRPDPGLPLCVFDGSILAGAAVSAPEVMIKLVTPTIDCFADSSGEEREVLFATFRTWLENDGSLRKVGELLFCHPNTVRYRLHRVEQRTGRCLSRPRDIAELSLAFEVHRRLMSPELRPHGGR